MDGKREVVSIRDADELPILDINQYSKQQASSIVDQQEQGEAQVEQQDQIQEQVSQYQPGQPIVYNNQQFTISEIQPDGSIVADNINGDESVLIPATDLGSITTTPEQKPITSTCLFLSFKFRIVSWLIFSSSPIAPSKNLILSSSMNQTLTSSTIKLTFLPFMPINSWYNLGVVIFLVERGLNVIFSNSRVILDLPIPESDNHKKMGILSAHSKREGTYY